MPADYELFADLSREEVAVVQARLERRKFKRGEVIVAFGAPAGELFFLARGCASATLPQGNGTKKRLGTFSPGMSFGEMAMLERVTRSAAVTADTEVECDLLSLEDFERLGESHPRIKLVLLQQSGLAPVTESQEKKSGVQCLRLLILAPEPRPRSKPLTRRHCVTLSAMPAGD